MTSHKKEPHKKSKSATKKMPAAGVSKKGGKSGVKRKTSPAKSTPSQTSEVPAKQTREAALAEACRAHALWLSSEGREGAKLDLTGQDLHGLSFGEANLKDASLTHSDLRGADLSRTQGLDWPQLAGCDLTRAKLPPSLAEKDPTETIKTAPIFKAATLFAAVLASSLFTVFNFSDYELLELKRTIPILNESFDSGDFFGGMPLFVLCFYFFIYQCYFGKLLKSITSKPAIFPDGTPLDQKVNEFLACLPLAFFGKLGDRFKGGVRFQFALFAAFCWWAAPLTLGLFWARYWVFHRPWMTAWHLVLFMAALLLARYFQKSCWQGFSQRTRDHRWFGPWQGLLFSAVFLIGAVLSYGVLYCQTDTNLPEKTRKHRYTAEEKLPRHSPRRWVPALLNEMGYRAYLNVSLPDETLSSQDAPIRLSERDFRYIRGNEAKFEYADFEKADFSYGYLVESQFKGARLDGAKFIQAYLDEADFTNAEAMRANFSMAAFVEAICERTNFEGATLRGADFQRARLEGALFKIADLQEANFNGTELNKVNFNKANLSQAKFVEVTFNGNPAEGGSFSYSNLKSANFTGAHLEGANFEGADLRGTDFSGAFLKGAVFKKATLCGANFRGAKGLNRIQIESLIGNDCPVNLEGVEYDE